MKEMKKKNASPDEMLDLEPEIDEAKKQVDKAKALEKAGTNKLQRRRGRAHYAAQRDARRGPPLAGGVRGEAKGDPRFHGWAGCPNDFEPEPAVSSHGRQLLHVQDGRRSSESDRQLRIPHIWQKRNALP